LWVLGSSLSLWPNDRGSSHQSLAVPARTHGHTKRARVSVSDVIGRSAANTLNTVLAGSPPDHVRKTYGPIVVFAGIEFVEMLPKTRSGKIMRRVLRRLWTGEPLGDLSTIEEEASVDEVREAIEKLKAMIKREQEAG